MYELPLPEALAPRLGKACPLRVPDHMVLSVGLHSHLVCEDIRTMFEYPNLRQGEFQFPKKTPLVKISDVRDVVLSERVSPAKSTPEEIFSPREEFNLPSERVFGE